MLLGFLRFIAYSLAFWFAYKVISGAMHYLSEESKPKASPRQQGSQQPGKSQPTEYTDVKDAQFKDLPNDSKKPS